MPKVYRKKYLKHKKGRESNAPIFILLGVLIIGGALIFITATSRPSSNPGGFQLPAYAYRSPTVTESYVAASSIPQIFQYIPCYCGCGYMTHLPYFHKNLRDCFISDQGEYQDHPLACSTCVEEAIEVWSLYQKNTPLREIRKYIEDKYSQIPGAMPTPQTPPVP